MRNALLTINDVIERAVNEEFGVVRTPYRHDTMKACRRAVREALEMAEIKRTIRFLDRFRRCYTREELLELASSPEVQIIHDNLRALAATLDKGEPVPGCEPWWDDLRRAREERGKK